MMGNVSALVPRHFRRWIAWKPEESPLLDEAREDFVPESFDIRMEDWCFPTTRRASSEGSIL